MSNQLITVAVFQYTSEAHIFRGKLESEGIKAILFDDMIIDVDPLYSNAIGGVKLKVYESDVERAKQIIAKINAHAIADDGSIVYCPKCNSDQVDYFSTVKDLKSFFWFIVGLFYSGLPFHARFTYRCSQCKHEFDL